MSYTRVYLIIPLVTKRTFYSRLVFYLLNTNNQINLIRTNLYLSENSCSFWIWSKIFIIMHPKLKMAAGKCRNFIIDCRTFLSYTSLYFDKLTAKSYLLYSFGMYNNKKTHKNVFTKHFQNGGSNMSAIMPKKTFSKI